MPFALATTGTRHGHAGQVAWLTWLRCRVAIDVAITGDASGSDTQTVLWAIDHGVFFVSVGADWETFGRAAGPQRNGMMTALLCEFALAGWRVGCVGFPSATKRSAGTYDCMRQMRSAGIKVMDARDASPKGTGP